jgi:hypothetical protein
LVNYDVLLIDGMVIWTVNGTGVAVWYDVSNMQKGKVEKDSNLIGWNGAGVAPLDPMSRTAHPWL